MLPDDARPQLPRRRPWRSDPALFDPGVPAPGRRPRLGKTFYSQRPVPPADFGWFAGRGPVAPLPAELLVG
ncbi:MAG: hypothetical protein ACJ73E_01635 [Mycobacteriales bacterium]